jgi:hypothetical protein
MSLRKVLVSMAPNQITPPTTPNESELVAALRKRDVPKGKDSLATQAANEIIRLNMIIRQCLQSIDRESVRARAAEDRVNELMGTDEPREVFDTGTMKRPGSPRRKTSLEEQLTAFKERETNMTQEELMQRWDDGTPTMCQARHRSPVS